MSPLMTSVNHGRGGGRRRLTQLTARSLLERAPPVPPLRHPLEPSTEPRASVATVTGSGFENRQNVEQSPHSAAGPLEFVSVRCDRQAREAVRRTEAPRKRSR